MVGDRFEERWARVDEALRLVRAQLVGQTVPNGPFDAVGGARAHPASGAAAGRARPAADRRTAAFGLVSAPLGKFTRPAQSWVPDSGRDCQGVELVFES